MVTPDLGKLAERFVGGQLAMEHCNTTGMSIKFAELTRAPDEVPGKGRSCEEAAMSEDKEEKGTACDLEYS